MLNSQEIIPLAEPKYIKIITDPIHKCIRLTNIEYKILQLPAFNRLHNIHQLGLAYYVYPPGKTTRFEHSLGVMNIASKMITRLIKYTSVEELENLFGLNPKSKDFVKTCASFIQRVRLAALLHDIGHGPFSHVTEPFLLEGLNDHEIDEAKELFGVKDEKKLPVHVYFSYKMINEGDVSKIIKDAGLNPSEIANLLTKSKDVPEAVRITRKIISSQLDADRMDNLLRDSHATGVPFGITDIDRIIHHLFIQKYKGEYELVLDIRALRSVEDVLDARFKMFKSVYNHHLVVALEGILRRAIKIAIEEGYLEAKEFHYKNFLKGEVDDIYIYNRLKKHYDSNSPLKVLFRPLIDRRYAPVSIIKRLNDFNELLTKISNKIGIESSRLISKGFIEWLGKLEKGEIKFVSGIKNLVLLGITKSFSPYDPLMRGEQIFIVERKNNRVLELTEVSEYIKALNSEWEKYQQLSSRIFYLISDQDKEKAKKQKEDVLEAIIKDVTKYIKENLR